MPNSHTLDIGTFGPYVKISDAKQGDLSLLSGIYIPLVNCLLMESEFFVRQVLYSHNCGAIYNWGEGGYPPFHNFYQLDTFILLKI